MNLDQGDTMNNNMSNIELSFDVSLELPEMLDNLTGALDHEQLLDVIKYIDDSVSDIEFTEAVHAHFEYELNLDSDEDEDEVNEQKDLDVETTLAIIKGIIIAAGKKKEIIHGVLDYIQELQDDA